MISWSLLGGQDEVRERTEGAAGSPCIGGAAQVHCFSLRSRSGLRGEECVQRAADYRGHMMTPREELGAVLMASMAQHASFANSGRGTRGALVVALGV